MSKTSIWHRSLVFKYALFATLLAMLAVLILSATVYSSFRVLLENQEQGFAKTITNQFSNSLIEPILTDDIFRIELSTKNLLDNPEVKAVQIFNRRTGDYLVNQISEEAESNFDLSFWLNSEFKTGNALSQSRSGRAIDSIIPSARFISRILQYNGVEVGQVGIVIESTAIKEAFRKTLVAIVLVTLLLMFICFASAVIVSSRFAKPLNQLIAITREIGRGDFHPKKLTLINQRKDELGYLGKALTQMTKNLQTKLELESVFNKVVDKQVASEFMAKIADRRSKDLTVSETISLDAKLLSVSVLFVDVVDFTGFSEKASPGEVVDLLNEYFSVFTHCANFFQGSVDKFIGDCAMIVFGAPLLNDQHMRSAVLCAAAISEAVSRFNHRRLSQSLPIVNLRIGVNSGEVFAGVIGATSRMEYTVIGDAVNIASRLCDRAKPCEILVGAETLSSDDSSKTIHEDSECLTRSFSFASPVRLSIKGKGSTVDAFSLKSVRSDKASALIQECVTSCESIQASVDIAKVSVMDKAVH